MAKIRFNDKLFKGHLDEWVQEVSDDDFTRAWEIVVGCLGIHAKMDRQPEQSSQQAKREAYEDFALAFEGEASTFTMVGMLHEFDQMCPDTFREDGTFEAKMNEAIAKARGDVYKAPAPPPVFTILEGGKE